MRDLFFVAMIAAMFGAGFKRPYLFVLTFIYIDIISPQRLTYVLLNSIPLSLIAFTLTFGAWALADDKRHTRVNPRQLLLLALLVYAGITTSQADFPVEALDKWSWVWKATLFSLFLPLTLTTRLRIESAIMMVVLSASAIIIVGGLKTLATGGGYGTLNLMIADNTGIYEGSIVATAAIAFIPMIWWLRRYGTIFPDNRWSTLFAAALTFACLLMPVGTQARTGLICIVALGVLSLRSTQRRGLYIAGVVLAMGVAMPLLPDSFKARMGTIKNHEGDQSASTRLAVWQWTWDYVQGKPFGGGFNAYLQNELRFDTVSVSGEQTSQSVKERTMTDKGRAFHSSYFEMLGEQGYPGFLMWAMLHIGGLVAMGRIRRRFIADTSATNGWISPLATALQHFHMIVLTGSLFVGIAWQSFILMFLAIEMGFETYIRRTRPKQQWSAAGMGQDTTGALAPPPPAAREIAIG